MSDMIFIRRPGQSTKIVRVFRRNRARLYRIACRMAAAKQPRHVITKALQIPRARLDVILSSPWGIA